MLKSFRAIALSLLVLSVPCASLAGVILRVPQNYATIQAAIDAAHGGDTVLVADGTYQETINFNGKDIIVGSLFLTTGDPAHISGTVIDAHQQGSAVTFSGGGSAACSLVGLTITGGLSNGGAGIYCTNAGPRLSNLIIAANHTQPDEWGGSQPGAGLYFDRSIAVLANVLVIGNTANIEIAGRAPVYLTNTSSVSFTHVTIADNDNGVVADPGSWLSVQNSIIWDNSAISLRGDTEYIQAQYSDVRGGWPGEGNIDSPPIFANRTGGDYSLSDFSPCIGRGNRAMAIGADLRGQVRPQPAGTAPDMGAFENARQSPLEGPGIALGTTKLGFGDLFLGDSLRMKLIVRNPGTLDLLIPAAKVDNPAFRVRPLFAGVHPQESDSFTVTFVPAAEQTYAGTLTLLSNAVNVDSSVVTLTGRGVKPPVASVTPARFDVSIVSGHTTQLSMHVQNSGYSDLRFTVYPASSTGNHALEFNGQDAYVDCGDNASLNVRHSITMEAWMYAFDWGGNRRILQKGGSDNQYRFLAEWGSFALDLAGVTGGRLECGLPSATVWHHVAGVYDYEHQRITIYQDGSLIATQTASGEIALSSDPLVIGAKGVGSGESGDHLYGMLDEVRIWNVARSQDEINRFRSLKLTGNEPGLVANWSFDEGSGTTTKDISPYGNNGTFAGGMKWASSAAPVMYWVACSPDCDTLAPSGSVEVQVSFDATRLDPSSYAGEIVIQTNDPLHKIIAVPYALVVTDVRAPAGKLPVAFSLEQNYPNPFNPKTVVSFQVPVASDVRLVVYDILGREVAMLVNEKKMPGKYEVEFDASQLSSGVYFYRLTAGQYVECRKMALVR
jgi:hypothetical protein